jgi:CheY-like chemotaxis protein
MKTALIIDDSGDIREVLQVLLESAGFQVDTLSDGIEALELEKRYDVILLDLKMPVFDGERLTDYWQLTDPTILNRVIVLSGYSLFTAGRNLATFSTIQKPFEHQELLRVVTACANNG